LRQITLRFSIQCTIFTPEKISYNILISLNNEQNITEHRMTSSLNDDNDEKELHEIQTLVFLSIYYFWGFLLTFSSMGRKIHHSAEVVS